MAIIEDILKNAAKKKRAERSIVGPLPPDVQNPWYEPLMIWGMIGIVCFVITVIVLLLGGGIY